MGAGKSSLVLRFVKGQFFDFQESTIGAAFLTQTVTVPDAVVKFEIWDTAGQERYHSLAPMYYRGERTHGLGAASAPPHAARRRRRRHHRVRPHQRRLVCARQELGAVVGLQVVCRRV